MTGDKHIINLRLNGLTPEWVFINDYPCQTPTDDKYPNVCVFGDQIESLDLRFLVNLRVSIASTSEDRAKQLFDRSVRSGAVLVASGHVLSGVSAYSQDGWSQVFSVAAEKEAKHG